MLCLLSLVCVQAVPQPSPSFPLPDAAKGSRRSLADSGDLVLVVDGDDRSLWLRGRVVLRDNLLEMFVCRSRTKEHESIVATDVPATAVHAGLLAVGLTPGKPVRFEPTYQPPSGDEVEIVVFWPEGSDAMATVRSTRSQDWIRHAVRRWYGTPLAPEDVDGLSFEITEKLQYFEYDKELQFDAREGRMTDDEYDRFRSRSDNPRYRAALNILRGVGKPKPMAAKWVFAGSKWYDSPERGREFAADAGNYVCVANFSDAIIDVARESTSTNASLLYETWTERIPAVGTPVWLRLAKAASAADQRIDEADQTPGGPVRGVDASPDR